MQRLVIQRDVFFEIPLYGVLRGGRPLPDGFYFLGRVLDDVYPVAYEDGNVLRRRPEPLVEDGQPEARRLRRCTGAGTRNGRIPVLRRARRTGRDL